MKKILVLFPLMIVVSAATADPIVGSLSLPRKWHVFGPVEQSEPAPSSDTLATLPTEIKISGRTLKPRIINVDDTFNRLDMEPLIGKTVAGRGAYVFIPFTAPTDMEVTLGFGADWWLQAWLDGDLIMDTMKDGNVAWPPTALDHPVTVQLTQGAHILAVKFVSGSSSSVLAVGGPNDLRKGRPSTPVTRSISVADGNLVSNSGFEAGISADTFMPIGWENGKGPARFREGELNVSTNAPIAGLCSLEINTLASGSVKRKVCFPLSADIDTCYEISFKANSLAGAGYASLSIRDDKDSGFNTGFIRAIGTENTAKAVKKGEEGGAKAYYFFDTPNPWIVISTHGPVHAMFDDINIVAVDRSRMWSTFNEQRAPWKRDWNTLSEAFVTPHTPWAKPYAGGTLDVLSLMPRRKHRLTVELAQRLSMRYTPIFFEYRGNPNKPSQLGGDYWVYDADGDPALFHKEADTLVRLAQPADCIVITELPASAVTPSVTEAILRQVADGTGLVIAGSFFRNHEVAEFKKSPWAEAMNEDNRTTEDTDWVRAGPASVNASPQTAMHGFFQYGKGRIAYWGDANLSDDRASLEDNLPYRMKAMLWASRRLPQIKMQDIMLPGQSKGVLHTQINREDLPGRIKVKVASTQPIPQGTTITAWLDDFRQTDDQPVSLGTVRLAGDASEATFEIPRLSANKQRVHFQIKRNGKIEDWSTVLLDVQVTEGIQSLALDRKNFLYTAGEIIKGRVVLDAPLKQNQKMRIRMTDADGRLWAEQAIMGTNVTMPFSLKTDPSVVLYHRIRAELIDAEGLVADAEVEFSVAPSSASDAGFFDYQLWVIPTDSFLVCDALRKCGVTSSYHEKIGRNHALNNIRGNPQVWTPDWGVEVIGDKTHAPVRSPCISDPEFREKIATSIEKGLAPMTKYGPQAYSIAHEWNFRSYGRLPGPVDICFCTNCVESFRRFAHDEYSSITTLNTAWGTEFKNWEKVTPIVLQDALKANQIARWIDHRRHVDQVCTDYLKFIMSNLRKNHPGAQGSLGGMRVGLTTLDSYSGVNFWKLYDDAAMTGYLDPYILSFLPRDDIRRNLIKRNQPLWHPDKNTGDDELFQLRLSIRPWLNLLDGAHGFTYYEEYFFEPPDSPWHPILNADLTPGIIEPANESVAQIRSGINRLIFESQPADAGIAILYSRSSEHAATAWQALHTKNKLVKQISPPDQMGFYTRTFEALGYPFRKVSEDQVAGGALLQDNCRFLILPFAQAISSNAVSQIREFVKGGGILLADIRPGMADQHGTLGTIGALDDVFGVQHQTDYTAYEPVEDAVDLKGMLGKTPLTHVPSRVLCGPALQVAGADMQAKTQDVDIPAFLVNRFGRGQAILMNFILPELDDQVLQMMSSLLVASGMQPLFEVEASQGKRSRSISVAQDSKDAPADAEGYSHEALGIARPILRSYSNGQIHCFGFRYPVRRGLGTERVRITPPAAGHIYDLKTNKYLGEKAQFSVDFALEDVAVYASVPYRISKPKLNLNTTTTSSGHLAIVCQARIGPDEAASEKHVVQFTLRAPDGTLWEAFTDTAIAASGLAEHRFVLPLDAPRGTWTVEAREAISGLTDRVSVVAGAPMLSAGRR